MALEPDMLRPFETEHGARLVRSGWLQRELAQDAHRLGDQIGVGLCQLAFAEIDVVLHTGANVAAHNRAHGDQVELVTARPEDAPPVVVPEQAVGGSLHVEQIFGIGADAAEYAKDGLHKERWLHEAAIEEVRKVIEVADVVALELEAGAVRAHRLQQALDVGEGITEDMPPR